MKRINKVTFTLSTLTQLTFALCALLTSLTAAATPQEASLNYSQTLVRQNARFFDEVYVQDNADFTAFTKVYIEAATLEFDDRWERDFRSDISPTYLSYVFKTFPRLMDEQLKQAFGNSERYQIVADKQQAQLVLAPKITQFYINGPEFSSLRDTFVPHVGRGKLEITVNDTAGTTLAKLVDARETRNFGSIGELRQANRARNYRDFRFLMKRWSDETVRYLQ